MSGKLGVNERRFQGKVGADYPVAIRDLPCVLGASTMEKPMRALFSAGMNLLLLSILSGCASEGVKRGAYEAIYQKGCKEGLI